MQTIKQAVSTAGTSVKNAVIDVADATLNGVHFVAMTTANVAESAKCRLHRDVDPEQIKREMVLSTCLKQQVILLTAQEARDKFRSMIPKGNTTSVIYQPTEELPRVMTLTVSDFQRVN